MPRPRPARELAVVLYDLAWLLPRTVGVEATRADPLPTSELEVMRLLARRPGASVTEVAEELGLRANNVSVAVRGLERRGLLRRVPDPADGRIVRLEPTTAAVAARDRREASWGAELSRALRTLTPADRAAVAAAVPALQHLAGALTTGYGSSLPSRK